MADRGVVILQLATLALVGGTYVYRTWRDARRRAQAATTETDTPIASVKDGEWARITGVVTAGRETTRSPVGGRPCVGFLLALKMRSLLSTLEPEESAMTWQECRPFVLADDSGRAIVEGPCLLRMPLDAAGWAELPPEGYALLQRAGVPLTTPFGRRQDFEFREALLLPGARVNIVARACVTIDPAGASTGHRSLPRLCTLRGDKKAPVMVTPADSN